MARRRSNETFVSHGRGRKRTDAALHRPMLANYEADRITQTKSARIARAYGMSADAIKVLYPLAN